MDLYVTPKYITQLYIIKYTELNIMTVQTYINS